MQNGNRAMLNAFEKIQDVRISNFTISKSFEKHMMLNAKNKLMQTYFIALKQLVEYCSNDKITTDQHLKKYQALFVERGIKPFTAENNKNSIIKSLVNNPFKPWRKKYRYLLLCDAALMLFNENDVKKAQEMLSSYLGEKQSKLLAEMTFLLFNDEEIPSYFLFVEDLIKQYRANRIFALQPEKRFIITANMSAGKSTLINALIGKKITQTSQEACTSNLCYIYNKPFEDNAIHLMASALNLDANYDDLKRNAKTNLSYIAAFFQTFIKPHDRICLIDTPGVNSAIYREHGKLARKAINEESYDYLIYVFNANRLGTDEEIKHLNFVTNNVPMDKIVFIVNKLDDFNANEDSIELSVNGVRQDLLSLGYENPIICPLSAYFALLIKLKQNGIALTDDENDEFDLYSRKFSKPEYDLSHYYDQSVQKVAAENNLAALSARCGLYGLEKILYEGK